MNERLTAALADRYRIERQIGEGGMAFVYLATDLRHDRSVALKVLRPELAATMGPDRFLQEIRVTAKLQHPHILPLFESGEADGFLYYVMPFLDGESLRERVERESELPVAEVLTILREVVDALATAHAAGVVHRDIKPDNVMLSGRHAVVTDFGVAKAVSDASAKTDVTTKGVAIGTPTYMAPEQAAANEHIDHRADIYAVGAMAYELLAGRPPFTGNTAQQVLAAHVTEVPRPLTELRSTVAPQLASVVMRCLEKKPADRWQSADDLLGQLNVFATPSMGVTPTHSRPATVKRGAPAWLKLGLPAAAAVGAVLWLVSGAGVGGGGAADGTAAGPLAVEDVPVEELERLIVMPLDDLSGDPEITVWGKLAADEMARAVDQARPIPVVPSNTVANAIRGLGDGATTEAVAGEVLASHAFAGTIARLGDQLRFDVELIDVRGGERLRTLDPVTGPFDKADSLVSVLASAAATLAVGYLDPDRPPGFQNLTPPISVAAFEALREQTDIFCTGDNRGSLEPGYRALALSPDYPAALLYTMVAHSNLGEDQAADSLIEVLEGVRDRMTRPERLLLDWMIGNREGDQGVSARTAEELYRIAPSEFAGNAMLTAYRQRRMEDAIERYRDLASFSNTCPWPGNWTQGSVAFHTLGRFEEELAVGREGLEYYPGRRSMMDIEMRVFAAFGRVEQVDSLLQVMDALPPDGTSDPNLRGVYAALELTAHGFPEEGRQIMERTVADLSDSSERNRARIHYWSGRYDEAVALYEELLEAEPERVDYLWAYGASLARLGYDRDARAVIERLGRLDPTHLAGSHIWGQGLVAAALGERDEAVRLLQAAFDAGRGYFSPAHREPALAELRGYAPFDALMAPR